MTIEAAPVRPDLSIRTQPPSPKRLSRKVLLSGALAAGGVISWALIAGLSDQRVHAASQPQAVAATTGPPEKIANASSDYDPAALKARPDMVWGDHPPPSATPAAEEFKTPVQYGLGERGVARAIVRVQPAGGGARRKPGSCCA